MIAAAVIIFAIVLVIFAMAIAVLMRLEAGAPLRYAFFVLLIYAGALAVLGFGLLGALFVWIAVGFGIASINRDATSIIKREKV